MAVVIESIKGTPIEVGMMPNDASSALVAHEARRLLQDFGSVNHPCETHARALI